MRWHGNGETTAGDHCYFWSGPERRTGLYGVALAIPKALRKSLISWSPLSDRLLSARFLHQHGKMTVIVAYAPPMSLMRMRRMPSLTNSIRLLAKLHHTTSPSSSPMPMPLCLAVIGPLTHLSAQFLLTGLQRQR